LTAGDVVVFFAADRLADRRPEPGRYQFVGYATVDRKVSQLDIWQEDSLAVFRSYQNLLLRPSNGGYEHHEHGPRRHWHDNDWLWRLTNMAGVRRDDLRELNDTHRWHESMTLLGQPLVPYQNYVLFRPEGHGTFVSAEPPVVAYASSNGRPETWNTTPFARQLHNLVLEGSRTRRVGLRTRNVQTSHPHVPLLAHPATIATELGRLCVEHGVTPRAYART
jgi:hypothetical protein